MDVSHLKTRRKILDLYSQKVDIGILTLKGSIIIPEAATRTKAKAEVKAKIDLCIACIMREI
jgi:hypothetical protein